MRENIQISDHGVIGNLRTAALVARDGCIDWACIPDFDSPSVFARLLDRDRGGHFRIWAPDATSNGQAYAAQTNVLLTRFGTSSGICEVEDLMPIEGRSAIVRVVTAVAGRVRFAIDCSPRFDFGRSCPEVVRTPGFIHFESPSICLDLACPEELTLHGASATGEFELEAGNSSTWVLTARDAKLPRPSAAEQGPQHRPALQATLRFWREWLSTSPYRGRWRREVERSLLVLKLLTHRPSGGIAAAVTTSIPEVVGGTSNWDYRFCWVRDACWTIDAFMALGYHEEARAFMRYLARQRAGEDGGDPLKVAYSLSGTSLEEETVEGLDGYYGSRPVRVGNAAAFQRQLDMYGEYARAAVRYDESVERINDADWQWLVRMGEWLIEHMDEPDAGLWESRDEHQQYVHSKIQIWVALDCLLKLAARRSLPLDVTRVRQARDHMYACIRAHGWSKARGSYTASYGSSSVDAALLLLEQSGLVSTSDDRLTATLSALESDLLMGRALMRRRPEEHNAFCACSFWMVEVLAHCGRREEAQELLERLLTYGNHLGLYSEEIEISGALIGNFPQALTHLALIRAVLALGE